jgi:hypothetical protein
LQDIFSCLYREYKEAHKKGSAEKIRVRRSLSYNSITHLYFFAESFGPKKNGAPQVQKILDEYTEFFKAARARKCLYVTIELLWVAEQHQDKNNIPLLKNLCDLIKNANRDEPRLKVCIVTTNKAVAANVSEQFF